MITILAAGALATSPVASDFDLSDTLVSQTVRDDPAHVSKIDENRIVLVGPDFDARDTINHDELRQVLFHLANAADLATTIYCIEGRDDCREANPVYGQRTERVVAGKVITSLIFEWARNESHLTDELEWGLVGILTVVAGNNIKVLL